MAGKMGQTGGEGRGVRRYLTVLIREFPDWVGLNLVFLLSCLPLVTVGPALSALGHVLGRMARGESGAPVRRYWAAFRARFLSKVLWGLAFLAVQAVLIMSAWFYLSAGEFLFPLAELSLAGTLCLWGIGLHLFPALCDDQPPRRPLKAALVAFFISFAGSLLAAGAALVLLLAQVLLFPAVLPLTLAGGAVLPGLALVLPTLRE